MKKFTYKNYRNCFFIVSSYAADEDAMAISIENNSEGPICTSTIYDRDGIYCSGITTIKNYSENSFMTKFLEELGIIESIIDRRPCNPHVYNTLNTEDPQTIDTCVINLEKLKEYTKEWNYNV